MNAIASPSAPSRVNALPGVGPILAAKFARLGVHTLEDVLFFPPLRYEDRTRVTPIATLKVGVRALIQGALDMSQEHTGRRRSLVGRLNDGSGTVGLRFFHYTRAQREQLVRGVALRCYGEVRAGHYGLELVHPQYRRIDPQHPLPVDSFLTPIYKTTEGLGQTALRKLVTAALPLLERGLCPDWLPAEAMDRLGMPSLREAIEFLHRPPPEACMQVLLEGRHPAQRRIAFEELLAHQLGLRRLRAEVRRHCAPRLRSLRSDGFLQRLPFALTTAQKRVWKEIANDLTRNTPMLRLLQGDVGSGKTVVAAAAALQAWHCGFQAAVMAPTELLAEQHLRTFRRWLGPEGVPLVWLSGSLNSEQRARARAELATGDPAIAIGTHALFQKGLRFSKLGLCIVDEQHRFGVFQRLALRDQGVSEQTCPHQLIMTATPIPRTLAMTAYADLDVSVLDEQPPNRQRITTVVVSDRRRAEVMTRIAMACACGRQVYWVCTRIDQSEALQCQAVTETAAQLAQALPSVAVALIHGRMKTEEKDRVMAEFSNNQVQVLVATTVIEVGVDIPNASLMIIDNADRLGLAQLHQLRGRVGRGTQLSDCVLMYRAPLS
ncbi:MAG: ATP-dependent DNA helicase RecG, partial [Gammaproteobacteria bacterium]